MKKKWICVLLVMSVMIMGLGGCASKKNAEEGGSESTNDSQETGENDLSGNSEDKTEESQFQIPELSIEPYDIPDTEALAFTADMKIGWNLGNTFDAYTEGNLDNELDSETLWVSTATTKEMIDNIKAAGFNTLRLPVTWHTHLLDDAYTISPVWLDRVQEVMDYAIDNDMYVILNIHHDNDETHMYPDSAHLEQSLGYVTAIWEQLAARFAEYDDHLIFEAMNEPRLVGSTYEWWISNSSEECQDAIACINELNQAFVDTVRAGGGNNETRYLMVPGYDASVDGATNSGFVLPTDPVDNDNHIIVSVHAYTPYGFALQADGESGSTSHFDVTQDNSTRDIITFMDKLYNKYISQGIPVVIGEFGARNKNLNTQDRVDYAAYYIAAARARGITCAWWDNNAFTGNGENFGLYYRLGNYFIFEDIVNGMMKYAE